jgi:GNAT superfamily N-acetyltransferase
MPDQFIIRPATVDDADTIADHRARMFHEMGDVPTEAVNELRAKSGARILEMIMRDEYLGWLAFVSTDPDVMVGGAGVQLRGVLPHPLSEGDRWIGIANGRHATVINVFTEPAWRRRGIAILLLQQIIDWARIKQLDRLVLHASDAGRTVYERLGFIRTNEMRFAPGNNHGSIS